MCSSTVPRSIQVYPSCLKALNRVARLLSLIWLPTGVSQKSTSSLPVDRIPMIGFLKQRTLVTPTVASIPTSAGPISCPFLRIDSPIKFNIAVTHSYER